MLLARFSYKTFLLSREKLSPGLIFNFYFFLTLYPYSYIN